MLNESTKENLRRKSGYIDIVQIVEGHPLFSWIDINVTELCNRKCIFCPRVDPDKYPNQNIHMSIDLAKEIGNQLEMLNYNGVVVFSGYSEPMQCPHLEEIIAAFPKKIRLEMVTNGDFLKPEKIKRLYEAGLNYFVVSMYDGPEQTEKFKKMFNDAGLNENSYILRDRWHNKEDSFGLKLTNRAGTITIGDQPEIEPTHPCYYTAYSLTIDWNGDVMLCMQDWNKKIKFGNASQQPLVDIWNSKALNSYRKKLINGNRTCSPCYKCNTDGTLHGHNHATIWNEILK
ncbi:radical SAM/SPASM domain-containing protein [Aeromonas veronii]|uniref:radical SAM/SPASM domain-containing protein n=1 Tax=Aeromonas veronii TaxID=654 RepID=UPI001F3AFE42|nr:radical SAM/SPASM domain-containing protein [Aeromonas veronii]MCF5839375.1 SPASM domain-containing protein [Aeromonas veronii]MCF5889382.1 SPASM domain-containing protein [Aeromonas veronii]